MFSLQKFLLTMFSVAVPASATTLYIFKKIKTNKDNTFANGIRSLVGISPKEEGDNIVPDYFLKLESETKSEKPNVSIDKTAEEVLKDFLKTYTGAELLFKKIVETIIDNEFSNQSKEWDDSKTFEEFTKKKNEALKALETSENIKLKTQLNGDNGNKYIELSLLDTYQKLLTELLEQHLDIYLNGREVESDEYDTASFDTDKVNFELSSSATQSPPKKIISLHGDKIQDKFKKSISEIWNKIFEDWYAKEQPISIKKFTWKYATSFQKGEYKFKEANKDLISLPSNPNYFFPSFDKATNKKFKDFVPKIATIDSEKDLLLFNDIDEIEHVVNVSSDNLNSREAIALLYLQHPDTFKNSTVKVVVGTDEKFTPPKQIETTGITDKNLLEIFGIKPSEEFKDDKTDVVDFGILKGNKGILYRDATGIHYITKKADDKKELLINALYKNKVAHSNQFDLFAALKAHLRKNFYEIFINHFCLNDTNNPQKSPALVTTDACTDIKQKCVNDTDECNASNTKCMYQTSELLAKLFETKKTQQKIYNLRNKLLKDYFQPINTQLITTKEASKIELAKQLIKGYSVTFPTKVNWSDSDKNKVKSLINLLEDTFNPCSDPKDQSKLSENFKTTWDSYKSNVDKLLADKTAFKKEIAGTKKITFTFLKDKTDIQAAVTDSKPKPIDVNFVLESVFVKALSENLIQKLLINKQKMEHIKNYDFEKYEYQDTITADQFLNDFAKNYYQTKTDPKTQQTEFIKKLNNAIAIENNLQELFTNNKFLTFKDWTKINNSDTFFSFLKSAEKERRYENSSEYRDELSDTYTEFVDQLNTIHWLINNNFKNYQEHLQLSIKNTNFGAFVFTNKFDPKLCVDAVSTTEDKEKWNKLWKYDKHFDNIKKFFNDEKGDSENKNCVNLYDQFSIVETKIGDQEKQAISGYKGFVHEANQATIHNLPNNAWTAISSLLKNDKEKFTSGYLNTSANLYTTYLIAVRKEDLKDFDKFLKDKDIGLDVILRDVVRIAKEKSMQQKAFSYFLSNGEIWDKSKEYQKFNPGDWRLQNTIPQEWIS